MEDFQADIAAVNRITAVPTILDVVCRTTGMGFAAVARVTSDRWIACNVQDNIAFGLQPGGELEIHTTICSEIRATGEPVIINHVDESDAYRSHHTPALYGFQSYISMPIVLRDGAFFGTLCAIDPRPHQLDKPETISMFKLFADLIAFHLDAHERLASSEANLSDERKDAELREQFIAVLGHDLRNPLASIDAGARILLREPLSDKGRRIAALMQASVTRMAGLIDNVMDLARGRLGGGIALSRSPEDLEPVLVQIVAELRSAWPSREIDFACSVPGEVDCDAGRIGQLFSNLLGNALTHGTADGPVRVRAATDQGLFRLTVVNRGADIPAAALERLFSPFVRGDVSQPKQGLGLGLYIAAEIAKAHGGRLSATSAGGETCFTFEMPLGG